MTDAQSIRWAVLFLRDQPGLPPEAQQAAAALPELLEQALDALPNSIDGRYDDLAVDLETALGMENDDPDEADDDE